ESSARELRNIGRDVLDRWQRQKNSEVPNRFRFLAVFPQAGKPNGSGWNPILASVMPTTVLRIDRLNIRTQRPCVKGCGGRVSRFERIEVPGEASRGSMRV